MQITRRGWIGAVIFPLCTQLFFAAILWGGFDLMNPHIAGGWLQVGLLFYAGLFEWPGMLLSRTLPSGTSTTLQMAFAGLVNWTGWFILSIGYLDWRGRRKARAATGSPASSTITA